MDQPSIQTFQRTNRWRTKSCLERSPENSWTRDFQSWGWSRAAEQLPHQKSGQRSARGSGDLPEVRGVDILRLEFTLGKPEYNWRNKGITRDFWKVKLSY